VWVQGDVLGTFSTYEKAIRFVNSCGGPSQTYITGQNIDSYDHLPPDCKLFEVVLEDGKRPEIYPTSAYDDWKPDGIVRAGASKARFVGYFRCTVFAISESLALNKALVIMGSRVENLIKQNEKGTRDELNKMVDTFTPLDPFKGVS